MPELPDVEAMRAVLASDAAGREIGGVEVRDASALGNCSADDLREACRGRALDEATRHGKALFARAAEGPWLALHFGMTGNLAVIAKDEDMPEHTRIAFDFADGGRLAFDNPRKFGWLDLARDIDGYLAETGIGPDALTLSEEEVAEIVGGTRGQVKPALMDQSKLAGIGNVYSDEILFRARLRPDAKGTELSDAQLTALHGAMREVLSTACDRLSRGETLPEGWLARRRADDGMCPVCGGDLAKARIAGRTARFCPSCQKPAGG